MIFRILRSSLLVLSLLVSPWFLGQALAEEPVVAEVVNINTADAETMAAILKGIGLKKAQAIVAHREQYGAFKTVGELGDVKGIGEGLLAKNQDRIKVE